LKTCSGYFFIFFLNEISHDKPPEIILAFLLELHLLTFSAPWHSQANAPDQKRDETAGLEKAAPLPSSIFGYYTP
jgi:hypothetical protein